MSSIGDASGIFKPGISFWYLFCIEDRLSIDYDAIFCMEPLPKISSSLRAHLWSLSLLVFVVLLVFRIPLLTGTMPLHTDGQFMTFPALSYFKYWALHGQYPVWWATNSVAGNMADTASIGPAWLLFTPLILLLRMETAWFLMLLLMYFMAGLTMYFYLFHKTRHSLAALFGALLFMRSEWVTDCLVEPQIQIYLFPLILLCIEKMIERSGQQRRRMKNADDVHHEFIQERKLALSVWNGRAFFEFQKARIVKFQAEMSAFVLLLRRENNLRRGAIGMRGQLQEQNRVSDADAVAVL